MKTMNVKTGYGYFKDTEGNIISKYELRKGSHPHNDEFTYTEVDDKKALDNIAIYVKSETKEEVREKKIRAEVKKLAIASLIKKGEL